MVLDHRLQHAHGDHTFFRTPFYGAKEFGYMFKFHLPAQEMGYFGIGI